ncbi:phospholipid/cholesterol/gamma-HCH transport system substrate-binding protein [Lacinutrix venerupis]|uniref:MlaD family protein n=1 Tax=Lacinutrix venerupis TaxID=1486034 RepID=UPI000EB2463E|nr:MlaD family protein [Lacinutrix venerupis]RLJ68949.1 phospholipid/cholesterol/gamma-HCH transport system substrate-binding protein [Lacinutrix venerupis]
MKITREVKTAILAITGILLFIFGFSYLKGKNLLDDSIIVYAKYDNVEGLTPSTPVTINGYIVGKVLDIYFEDESSGVLVVKMDIDTKFKFSKNSKAELFQNGFIGGKAVQIIPAYDNAANAEDGDYLKSQVKEGMMELVNERLTPLQEKIEKVMSETDTLLVGFNNAFDAKAQQDLKNSIASLNATVSSFNATAKSLNSLIDNNKSKLDNTITNFENTSGNLSTMTDKMAQVDIAKTVEDLQSTIKKFDNLIASVENGEGSIGKLLKDDELYKNLSGASNQMEELLQDMKLNPKRYVHFSLFGKKPKRYDAEGNEIEDQK